VTRQGLNNYNPRELHTKRQTNRQTSKQTRPSMELQEDRETYRDSEKNKQTEGKQHVIDINTDTHTYTTNVLSSTEKQNTLSQVF